MTDERLLALAEMVERAGDEWRCDALNRELHEIDPRRNVNGSCANYLGDLFQAKRLIPEGHCYSISSDVNEVRAVVAVFLTERAEGFSAINHGPHPELRALVAASLRARAMGTHDAGDL